MDSLGQSRVVADRYEQPCLSVDNCVRDSSHIGTDTWHTLERSLDIDEAEAFEV